MQCEQKYIFIQKIQVSAYFNIFKYAVTRLLLTKFVYINSEKSYTMCTNQVILSKITTEPPKTKQKLEI